MASKKLSAAKSRSAAKGKGTRKSSFSDVMNQICAGHHDKSLASPPMNSLFSGKRHKRQEEGVHYSDDIVHRVQKKYSKSGD